MRLVPGNIQRPDYADHPLGKAAEDFRESEHSHIHLNRVITIFNTHAGLELSVFSIAELLP